MFVCPVPKISQVMMPDGAAELHIAVDLLCGTTAAEFHIEVDLLNFVAQRPPTYYTTL